MRSPFGAKKRSVCATFEPNGASFAFFATSSQATRTQIAQQGALTASFVAMDAQIDARDEKIDATSEQIGAMNAQSVAKRAFGGAIGESYASFYADAAELHRIQSCEDADNAAMTAGNRMRDRTALLLCAILGSDPDALRR